MLLMVRAFFSNYGNGVMTPNKRLMGAAPDLLAAARLAHAALLERLPHSVPGGEEACEALFQAITKAAPFRPVNHYAEIQVTVCGIDVPVTISYTGSPSEDELYEMAKEQLRKLL